MFYTLGVKLTLGDSLCQDLNCMLNTQKQDETDRTRISLKSVSVISVQVICDSVEYIKDTSYMCCRLKTK